MNYLIGFKEDYLLRIVFLYSLFCERKIYFQFTHTDHICIFGDDNENGRQLFQLNAIMYFIRYQIMSVMLNKTRAGLTTFGLQHKFRVTNMNI
jgi:hypothetical protein